MRALVLAGALVLLACDDDCPDCTAAPNGDGVCCPTTAFRGCSPGEPKPAGGWAASGDQCRETIDGFDGYPFAEMVDEHGCPVIRQDRSAPGCGIHPDDDGSI